MFELSKVIVIDFSPFSAQILFGLASSNTPLLETNSRLFDAEGGILSWEALSKYTWHCKKHSLIQN